MAGVWVTDHRQGACGHWEYPDGLKTCKTCGEDLPLAAFKGKANKSGYITLNTSCRVCFNLKKNMEYRLKHPNPGPRNKFKEYPDNTRQCSKCETTKDLSEFFSKLVKGVRRPNSICKVCSMAASSKYVKGNSERRREVALDYYYRNKPRIQAKVTLAANTRRALKVQATVKWCDSYKVLEMYEVSVELFKSTGIPHQVDHIIPLKSDFVCGLHCHTNLRVITAQENKAKNNLHWPDMSEITPELKAMAKAFKEKEQTTNV